MAISSTIPASGSTRLRAFTMLVALACLMLAGCNTTEGAGKDIKRLGKGIEEAAKDAKD